MTTQPPSDPATTKRWRSRSLWLDSVGEFTPRPALEGDIRCDVAIVGGGMTGLWTAYYLATMRPELDIVVVEKETAGFGPSGRNGGWVSSMIAGSARAYGLAPTSPRLLAATRATFDAVDEIGAVVDAEGIDCGFRKAGIFSVANTDPQAHRLGGEIDSARRMGLAQSDIRELTLDEAREYVDVPGLVRASFNAHGARANPAKLTRGVADACERRGVRIFEQTEATAIDAGAVTCTNGTVRARSVIRATEAYTVQLPGEGRRYLPLYSLMIATEPLSEQVWAEIGWPDGLLIRDVRHLFFYAQRTDDGRIAIGGRGAPYEFGSPIAEESETNEAVKRRLKNAMDAHFPAARDAAITHHWGGPLAVPRDWSMSIRYDRTTGLGEAGGYAGHGVVAANISGRTMAHLVLEESSPLISLPWVDHRSRSWEPEPLRYIASRAIVRVLERADKIEEQTGHGARSATLVKPFMPPR